MGTFSWLINCEIFSCFCFSDHQPSALASEPHLQHFVPNQAREKWIKKRTSVKIKNGASNHRGNDMIVVEGRDQVGSVICHPQSSSINYLLN